MTSIMGHSRYYHGKLFKIRNSGLRGNFYFILLNYWHSLIFFFFFIELHEVMLCWWSFELIVVWIQKHIKIGSEVRFLHCTSPRFFVTEDIERRNISETVQLPLFDQWLLCACHSTAGKRISITSVLYWTENNSFSSA